MEVLPVLTNSSSFNESKQILSKLGLVVKEYLDSNLYLIKYDKKVSDMNNDDVKKCRGLVATITDNKTVCAPPFKSMSLDSFVDKHSWDTIHIEEFIDGTMINCFNYNNTWTISTRSTIGGECKWYSNKTFSELFSESCGSLKLEDLNSDYFYTFVLTHPENRIVTKYDKPTIVLVSVGHIKEGVLNYLDIHSEEHRNLLLNNTITIPKRYQFNSLEEIKNNVNTLDYSFQGYVLKVGEDRTKIRNEHYNYVRVLKGNSRNLKFLYFELLRDGFVNEYIKYYPEERPLFNDYYRDFLELVKQVYMHYRKYHITKEIKVIGDIPFKLRPLCYEVHGLYIKHKIPITYNAIFSYLISLPIPRLLFTLRTET